MRPSSTRPVPALFAILALMACLMLCLLWLTPSHSSRPEAKLSDGAASARLEALPAARP